MTSSREAVAFRELRTSKTTTSKKRQQSKSIHLRMKLLGLRAGMAADLQIRG
jgi:hypothetical protein